ncbi:MAG: response regulator [Gemmatimonadota bacterium]|nr:MAG: response regulator [Gemmatimonadota bacterium]
MAKILVVDDEQAVLISLKGFLEQVGHDVVLAGSGLEALAILNETRVDVAFVDVVMPKIDGRTLVRRLQQDHPRVKIVIMWGVEDVIDLPGRELGVILALRKPFTLDEVQAVLESATNGIASAKPEQ